MLELVMIYRLFLIFTFLAIFVSGINMATLPSSILLSIIAISFGLINIVSANSKIVFPRHFGLMTIFVIALLAYPFFISNKLNPFYFATIFATGLFYWLILYNLNNGSKILRSFLTTLTLLYSFFYTGSMLFNLYLTKFSSLFFQEGPSRHYHIGDLWALTLVVVIGSNWGKMKLTDWLLVGLGFVFLIISNARSAYLSLLLGFIYIIYKKARLQNFSKLIPTIFISSIIVLFVIAGTTKTILFSRPYFLQSIQAFTKFPLGVGMGNFTLINEHMLKTTTAKEISLSSYTHNIFLEALSGVGVFSVLFLIFLFKITKDILQTNSAAFVWGALPIAILTNFMFDTTYVIPGLIWIFFISLAVLQNKNNGGEDVNLKSQQQY